MLVEVCVGYQANIENLEPTPSVPSYRLHYLHCLKECHLLSALFPLQAFAGTSAILPLSSLVSRARRCILLQPRWVPCNADTEHRVYLRADMSASRAPDGEGWRSLAMPKKELCLAFTLPTGQSFRWRKTGNDVYTGVVHKRVVRHLPISSRPQPTFHAGS